MFFRCFFFFFKQKTAYEVRISDWNSDVCSSDLARHEFTGGRDYLSACTLGLPPRGTVEAVRAELERAATGHPDVAAASHATERSRAAYARLVHAPVSDVAIAAQTSVAVSLVAASVPDGSEVLCADGDFSSVMLPFAHAGRGVRLRSVPLSDLAAAIGPDTWLVAFSLVQSATGEVADAAEIVAAARTAGARTLCDVTQRSEEHTSELQSLMRISYAVICL